MRGDFLHPRGRLRPYFNPIFPSLPVPAMPFVEQFAQRPAYLLCLPGEFRGQFVRARLPRRLAFAAGFSFGPGFFPGLRGYSILS